MSIREDADKIIKAGLKAALPDTAVKRALAAIPQISGKLILVAIGKASWQMARAAYDEIGDSVSKGIVITKHGHSMGEIGKLVIREAGHPVPDKDSYSATKEAVEMVSDLKPEDIVLFLISGGGSALFEMPLISPDEMDDISRRLLASGADITEINTIRKRLSAVKGGRFGRLISPAKVFSIVLSDVLGDRLDVIASGPAYPDLSTCEEALSIVKKYRLKLSKEALEFLKQETPKELTNVKTAISGSLHILCEAAAKEAASLGYKTEIVSENITSEAKSAGHLIGETAKEHAMDGEPRCFIWGGETVVHVTGTGLGGRNQELALTAAMEISGIDNVLIFSLGSDGTDGPCDAAGGIVDGNTEKRILESGHTVKEYLDNNDAYNGLKLADGLIFTGPTGTNVNDLMCILIK